jgi:hypothetical protein
MEADLDGAELVFVQDHRDALHPVWEVPTSGDRCAKPDQLERECPVTPREIALEALAKCVEHPRAVLRQIRSFDCVAGIHRHGHEKPLLLPPVPHRVPTISHPAEALTRTGWQAQLRVLLG